jgi:hypothetical protein
VTAKPASAFSLGLLWAGGIAWIYGLFVAFSAITGQRFEISGDGVERGIPLPSSWPHVGLFVALGAALWLTGRRWDAPRFRALRARRPWLMPAVGVLVIFPGAVVVIFLLVR